MSVLHRYVYGVGVAEEVVQVAQYLLIGSHEEHSEVVGLVLAQRVYRQHVRYVAACHEVCNLSVAVAGDVL